MTFPNLILPRVARSTARPRPIPRCAPAQRSETGQMRTLFRRVTLICRPVFRNSNWLENYPRNEQQPMRNGIIEGVAIGLTIDRMQERQVLYASCEMKRR